MYLSGSRGEETALLGQPAALNSDLALLSGCPRALGSTKGILPHWETWAAKPPHVDTAMCWRPAARDVDLAPTG